MVRNKENLIKNIVFLIFLILVLIIAIMKSKDNKNSQEKNTYSLQEIEGIIEKAKKENSVKKLKPEFWKNVLSEEEYKIIWKKGTEKAESGTLLDEGRKGIFFSKALKVPLFSSNDKYESGTGWPSFVRPIKKDNILTKRDFAYGWFRTEVLSKYGEHLGHVFKDGPKDRGGLRYCINSLALIFIPYEKLSQEDKNLFDENE